MAPIELRYEDGTIRIEGAIDSLLADSRLPFLASDPRTATARAPAFEYATLRAVLEQSGREYDDQVLTCLPLSADITSAYQLRPYQQAAMDDWRETNRWATIKETQPAPAGVLELPTGSGKTVLGVTAIEELGVATLIVVPTIDLLEQWVRELEREFDVPVGRFGGGQQRQEVLTVSTYDSAYLKADSVGDRFGLVIFDEVHHLGGEGYREIARLLAAPARMGLTATFERPDGAHETIAEIVGPLVHQIDADELAGDHLAAYDRKQLTVSLPPDEREAYDRAQETFTDYLARSNIQLHSGADYQQLVKRSGTDPAAREALLARQRAREIVYGSQAKIDALADILTAHPHERTIVFTAYNDLAYDVAERFLIPAITHQTPASERREILARFRDGTYSRVVTSNVLDEGVDVPDASVGVVLSGSGSEREFTQRLGRLLRPKADGGRAVLYEVIAENTSEEQIADRRHD